MSFIICCLRTVIINSVLYASSITCICADAFCHFSLINQYDDDDDDPEKVQTSSMTHADDEVHPRETGVAHGSRTSRIRDGVMDRNNSADRTTRQSRLLTPAGNQSPASTPPNSHSSSSSRRLLLSL